MSALMKGWRQQPWMLLLPLDVLQRIGGAQRFPGNLGEFQTHARAGAGRLG
jgi:hypothetical protein